MNCRNYLTDTGSTGASWPDAARRSTGEYLLKKLLFFVVVVGVVVFVVAFVILGQAACVPC